MARIVAKRNFRNGYFPEKKQSKVVPMPNVRVIQEESTNALYESYVEFLDDIGLKPQDITAKKIAESCFYMALVWLMLVVLL